MAKVSKRTPRSATIPALDWRRGRGLFGAVEDDAHCVAIDADDAEIGFQICHLSGSENKAAKRSIIAGGFARCGPGLGDNCPVRSPYASRGRPQLNSLIKLDAHAAG